MMHILGMAVMLLAALPVISCHHPEEALPELSVSIYIPDVIATKAETGSVGALASEKVFSSLQFWVFISGTSEGQLVGYKGFNASELAAVLADTGLPHSTITRFGMPLSPEMFALLSQGGTKVDVYALANAASVTEAVLGEGTTRNELDAIVLSGSTFGAEPLTMTVPTSGLPMSGVLKAAPVTGGYPVLNVSTVTLIRAVSKIRFVFCQQGTPASGTGLVPNNTACVVKSITFGGTSSGHDCQIAASEKLFTDQKYDTTNNLFDIVDYTPLTATLAGDPLMSNGDITVLAHPEELLFHSAGHESETAREYEERLDKAVAASSQIGPIYIRETDKRISGTIVYNAGEGDVEATFSMADDVLSRNHSWILFAYFAEATRTLQFKIVVLPWDKSTYEENFTTSPNIVNVVRRFTIPETDPPTFAKVQNINGYFDIHFWPILNGQPNIIKGDILIDSPVGQTIYIEPVAGVEEGYTKKDNIFAVSPLEHIILYPNHDHPENSRSEDSKIEYEISCNTDDLTDQELDELEGNYIDLHFCVKIVDQDNNVRWIDLDSESIDHYRIYLHKNWVSFIEND
ncbi:MAG: hypothetical protein J6W82_04890 [Bacteroidales bacterium]|nr:hypothetical protein [Bacteroidales bacterium]